MAIDPDAPGKPRLVPGMPAWDAQFGRGWAIFVVGSMTVLAIAFVALIAAETPVARVRWVAILVALFAVSFAGAVIYHLVNGIGIPMGFYQGERLIEERVIHPTTHPMGFRALIATFIAIAAAAIIGAGWMYSRADATAEYLLSHTEHP